MDAGQAKRETDVRGSGSRDRQEAIGRVDLSRDLPGGVRLPQGSAVLVVLFGRIGDVLFTLPAVGALKRRRPDLSIDWLVEDRCVDLLQGHPDLRRLILFRRGTLAAETRNGRLLQAGKILWNFLGDLRRERYAAVLDFQGLLKSGIATFLARGSVKLGSPSTYGTMREGAALFSRQVPLPDPSMHLVERHLSVVSFLLGEEGTPAALSIAFTPEERDRVSGLLGDRPYLVMHPFASWTTRNWPVSSWTAVVRQLEDDGLRLVLAGAGGREQEAFLKAVDPEGAGRVLSLLGRLTLRELALVMAGARAVIAADSGPMHLAAATGAPTLALFGPTDPVRLGPWGPGPDGRPGRTGRVLSAGLPCQPCMMRRCPIGTPCQTELSPDRVVRELRGLLAGVSSRPSASAH